jgi:uncharacterized protein YuzE
MAKRITPLSIGPHTFDHASYDKRGDVLYLSVGRPRAAVYGDETPEGHVLRYDEQGDLVGLTVIGAKAYLDRDGMLAITMPVPERLEVGPEAVEHLLAATA